MHIIVEHTVVYPQGTTGQMSRPNARCLPISKSINVKQQQIHERVNCFILPLDLSVYVNSYGYDIKFVAGCE